MQSWTPDYAQFRVSAATQAEMRRTIRQVTTPALLGVRVDVGVETDVGRVDAVARRFGGATQGDGRVFEEARTVRGALVHSFAPLGIHVYVLPPT